MAPDEELRRGAEAAQLLNNPLLIEAFATIETRLVGELKKIGTDPEKAERLRNVLIGLDKFRGYLTQVVSTGRMVELEESNKRSLRERYEQAMQAFRG